MNDAIIRRAPTTNSQVRSQASARKVSGGQSGTVTSAQCHYHPGSAPLPSLIHDKQRRSVKQTSSNTECAPQPQ
jgi:hypothetical protein